MEGFGTTSTVGVGVASFVGFAMKQAKFAQARIGVVALALLTGAAIFFFGTQDATQPHAPAAVAGGCIAALMLYMGLDLVGTAQERSPARAAALKDAANKLARLLWDAAATGMSGRSTEICDAMDELERRAVACGRLAWRLTIQPFTPPTDQLPIAEGHHWSDAEQQIYRDAQMQLTRVAILGGRRLSRSLPTESSR
jgi:hypothetical protein